MTIQDQIKSNEGTKNFFQVNHLVVFLFYLRLQTKANLKVQLKAQKSKI